MGITYRIDLKDRVTYVLYDGVVTPRDFIAHTMRLKADPDWPPPHKLQLTDITTQKNPQQISAAVIAQISRLWPTQANVMRGLKLAVVAGERFSGAEKFEQSITASGPTLIVFNTLTTACIWLGIDAERAADVLTAMRAEARNPRSE